MVTTRPCRVRAAIGQALTHAPQVWQRKRSGATSPPFLKGMASAGHASAHRPQRMQRAELTASSVAEDCDSGLQHHRQRRGQPFRNTSVRIPAPSWMEYRWTSYITPVRESFGFSGIVL